MKVRIDKDERYPDFSMLDIGNPEWFPEEIVDLTEEEIATVRLAEKMYREAQAFLEQRLEENTRRLLKP